jgi:septum site-determining protein MinC
LLAELQGRGIRIMGIEGAKEAQLEPSLPPLLKGGRPVSGYDGESPAHQTPQGGRSERQEPASLLLESPIRSGQSVIFPRGDITVVGSVASGAELVAGGSIHIHGALRGRAMAGSMGDPRARIFCRKNEAELLAIDGCYLTSEEMDPKLRGQPTQAYLEDGTLSIVALD